MLTFRACFAAASSESGSSKVGVIVTSVVVGSLVLAAAAGYLIYKYRLRVRNGPLSFVLLAPSSWPAVGALLFYRIS